LPGNRNDCTAYTESGIDQQCAGAAVMADRSGNKTSTPSTDASAPASSTASRT
jgi:hypothetical protein